MKNNRQLQILEILSTGAKIVATLAEVLLTPYGDLLKMRSGWYWPDRIKLASPKIKHRFNQYQKQKRSLHVTLFQLKKDGLVRIQEKSGSKSILITAPGRRILEKLRLKKKNELPPVDYKKQKDNDLKIVIFDIPEAEKRKRRWLRDALRNLDFSMLQKSVWMGQLALPEDFIQDLRDLNLLKYIEFFSINKKGTLSK